MEIRNESGDRDNFTMIPNFVYRLGMSAYAVALYGYIKQAAGETGRCFKSTSTIATELSISAGTVSAAKGELETNGLIKINEVRGTHGGKPYHSIAILNVWQRNSDFIAQHKKERSPVEIANSQDEIASSPSEIIKNPVIKNPVPAPAAESTLEGQFEKPHPNYGIVVRAYENTMPGTLTKTMADILKEAVDEYPADLIVDALKETAKARARSWNYTAAILKNWKENGRDDKRKTTPNAQPEPNPDGYGYSRKLA